jgi:hypothetical protein
MMTEAQYCISGGSLGGGFGRSVSVELGRKVNLSTSENTLVCLVGVGGEGVAVDGEEDDVDDAEAKIAAGAFSFSFPRPAKALKNPCDSFANANEDVFRAGSAVLEPVVLGPAALLTAALVPKLTLAGWKVALGL